MCMVQDALWATFWRQGLRCRPGLWTPQCSCPSGSIILCRTSIPSFAYSSCLTQAEFSHIGLLLHPSDLLAHFAIPYAGYAILESVQAGDTVHPDLYTGRMRGGAQIQPLDVRLQQYHSKRGYIVVKALQGPRLSPDVLSQWRTHLDNHRDIPFCSNLSMLRGPGAHMMLGDCARNISYAGAAAASWSQNSSKWLG